MKNLLLSFIFLVFNLILSAQNPTELIVFNTTGNVKIKREKQEIPNIQGEKMQNNDQLIIKGGNVTLINKENKRIFMDKDGKYSYTQLSDLMNKTEASITNRYFVYVWEKMTKEKEDMNKPGGIIRGDDDYLWPPDSVTILTDDMKFINTMPEIDEYTLFLKDEKFRELYSFTLNDSILQLPVADIFSGNHGKYFWEIGLAFQKAPEQRCFFIPEQEQAKLIIENIKKNIEPFSAYDEILREALINAYLSDNKLIIDLKSLK